MDSRRKAHYFQAHANAFGGRLETPFEQVLPVLAPTSLPSAGGYASARHEGFRSGEILSVERAYTQVAGSTSANGTVTTLATSVIEGLNVGNVFFAERIAAQISVAQRVGAQYPAVSFVGTEFLGLRIAGCRLEPVLRLDILDSGGTSGQPGPDKPPPIREGFLGYARAQGARFKKFVEELTEEERERHGWAEPYADDEANLPDEVAKRGNILCSVVDEIGTVKRAGEASCPWKRVGHAIEIPEFGRVFLGELVVSHSLYDLTMIRFDLGCPVTGTISGGQANAGGTSSIIAVRGSGGTTKGPP
jgi:hypothetical protein